MFQVLPIDLVKMIVTFFVCSPDEQTKSVDIKTIGTLMQVDLKFYSLCRQRYIWEFYYSTFFSPWKITKNSKHVHTKTEKNDYGRDRLVLSIHNKCKHVWKTNIDDIDEKGWGNWYNKKYKCTNLACYSGLELRSTETKFEIDELINKCGVKLHGSQKKSLLTQSERNRLDISAGLIEIKLRELEQIRITRQMLLKKERVSNNFQERFQHVFVHQQEIEKKKKIRKQKILAIKEATKLKLKREKAKKKSMLEAKKNELEMKQFFRAFQICPQIKTKTKTIKPRKKLTDEEKAKREIKKFFKNLNVF